MMQVLGPVFWLLVTLGLLVTFHEFGHFWVARRCGVRVLRFSVGFGKPLWTRVGKDGTEYVIAALPLGGYVKMLDEREVEVAPHERHEAFNGKPVWQRIAIVAAGPLANLLLCIALLWLMFVIGKPDYAFEIGKADGIAAEAGFVPGDLVLDIDGRDTPTLTEAYMVLATAGMDRQPTTVRVRTAAGDVQEYVLPLDRPGLQLREERILEDLGLTPSVMMPVDPVVGTVSGAAANEGGLVPGDRILAIADEPVASYGDIGPLVQKHAAGGELLRLRIARAGRETAISIDPRMSNDEGPRRWVLGITPADAPTPPMALLKAGPLEAVPAALAATWRMTGDTLGVLRRIVTGQASLKNISGPVTIARAADRTAGNGLAWYLNFLAVLSLSLCIMNLLPIPVLDGGHLLYYLIELVKGSPVGERVLVAGQYVGLVFLAGLMGLAFYNDLFRLFDPSF
jgi:regulator of sigma E protease